MAHFKWLASFVVAAVVVPTLTAETRCPGNVESLPFHLVNRHQMIVGVYVNHSGPYDFLLDTGMQVTAVDCPWPTNFICSPKARRWSRALDSAALFRSRTLILSKPVPMPSRIQGC